MPTMGRESITITWNKPTFVKIRVIDIKIKRAFLFRRIWTTTLCVIFNSILRVGGCVKNDELDTLDVGILW